MSKCRLMQMLLLLIFCISVGLLLYHMVIVPEKARGKVKELKDRFQESPVSRNDSISRRKKNRRDSINFPALQSKYPEVKAWLTIPDTGIDYPVLQSGKDHPEYYLKRNYQKKYDENGSLFFQYDCDVQESQNLIIYGHNMNSGAMFGNLDLFTEASYGREHTSLLLQTEKGIQEYKIVSVTRADATMLPFPQEKFPEGNGLQRYLQLAKRLSLYDMGEDLEGSQQVVTLVTCAYEWEGARTIVVAIKK